MPMSAIQAANIHVAVCKKLLESPYMTESEVAAGNDRDMHQ